MISNSGPVVFNNTVLRDGHQSLAATRMNTEQMLPALEILDSVGFGALETWGGATIDAGLRFLGEFPFDRLDALKKGASRTPHMMLLRGQNIVQYAHFPDDVVEAFVRCSAEHGMNIFRIFDALNDTRNFRTAVEATKKAGAHAQGTACYTSSPVHNVDTFIRIGEELKEQGCDSLCLKDMAGLIPPRAAYDIIAGWKKRVGLPVVFHSHETAGLCATAYYAAIEAGVDYVDTSIHPFANGTGQPDTLRMLSLLEGHKRCPRYDLEKLKKLAGHFQGIYSELGAFTNPANETIDNEALTYQVPGGMLSNFRNQLKEMKMTDRFDEVMAEIPRVRKALGWIPLVTPTSQIVGFQAVLNVKFGQWVNFSPQAMDIALGYYGRTPAPVDAEVRKLAAEKAKKDPITCRPADLQKPGMERLRKELREKGLPEDDEHCVIYAMFPSQLEEYHARRESANAKPAAVEASMPKNAESVAPKSTPAPPRRLALTVDGVRHDVTVEEVV